METRGSSIRSENQASPEARWTDGVRSGSSEDRSREDVARILGSSADDEFAVETGLAFDAPSVFVFERSAQEVESTELNGIDRLIILGRDGDDRLSVGPGVFGDREVPVLGGTALLDGVDVIVFRGGTGEDALDGDEADGPLAAHGGPGSDRLTGGSAADDLRGGAGDDALAGNLGPDSLEGGSGYDSFIYRSIADAPFTGTARERIEDFTHGEDVIDLGAIDAVPGGGNDAFRFLGNFSPEFQILRSGDLYYDPQEQALKGFVGDYVSYTPNFAIALPGIEVLAKEDLAGADLFG